MSPADASGWRVFWRDRGERELTTLLREAWPPLVGASHGEARPHATRVATLLGSAAPEHALASELGRMRAVVGAPVDPAGDGVAAARIAAWFEQARRA